MNTIEIYEFNTYFWRFFFFTSLQRRRNKNGPMAGAHLTAVLIPKIMRAFAFGILIFAFCLNRNVLQSSAANTRANKLRTRGEKIESNRNETFYISKSITIKHIKLLLFLNSKKWRCRERETAKEWLFRNARGFKYGSKTHFYSTRNGLKLNGKQSEEPFGKAAGWVDLYANFSVVKFW